MSYDDFVPEIAFCQELISLDGIEWKLDNFFKVFPNPSLDQLFVETILPLDLDNTFEIYSTSGQLVKSDQFVFGI